MTHRRLCQTTTVRMILQWLRVLSLSGTKCSKVPGFQHWTSKFLCALDPDCILGEGCGTSARPSSVCIPPLRSLAAPLTVASVYCVYHLWLTTPWKFMHSWLYIILWYCNIALTKIFDTVTAVSSATVPSFPEGYLWETHPDLWWMEKIIKHLSAEASQMCSC